jgi:hypothetical protein
MSFYFCSKCGLSSATNHLCLCSQCKEAYYCNKEHQRGHWQIHKPCCKFVSKNPESVWVELPPGDCVRFNERAKNHVFRSKTAGIKYVTGLKEFSNGKTSCPATSALACDLGWDVEIYCSGKSNILDKASGKFIQSRWMEARVRLGRPPAFKGDGNGPGGNFSEEIRGVDGTLFITGRRRSDGCPLNSNMLAGILAFKWQEEKERQDGSCSYSLSSKKCYLEKTWRMGPPVSWSLEIRNVYTPNVRTCPHVIEHINE